MSVRARHAVRALGVALAVAAALSVTAAGSGAQSGRTGHRLGALLTTTPAAAAHIVTAFAASLRERGYVEGRNLHIDYRWAEGDVARLHEHAVELVRAKVDLIVASGAVAAGAARKASGTIPIVMVNAADPVEAGLVTSLARPGGNVTGLAAQLTPEIRAKQVQLLKEALPRLERLVILRRAAAVDAAGWKDYESAAQQLGIRAQFVDVHGPDELESAFAAMVKQQRAQAVVVPGDAVFFVHRRRIVEAAAAHGLPGMYGFREFTDAGGLMSYSARLTDQFRRAAVFVDRILKGASPGDLPVEQPVAFELVINLRIARALGLSLPPAFVLRADEVIP